MSNGEYLMNTAKPRLGIDIGGTNTKLAVLHPGGEILTAIYPSGKDPVSSVHALLDRFLEEHSLRASDLSRVVLTGQRATFIKEDLLGLPTSIADEIRSIGLGGLYLSGLEEALVVSMGTGTAYVLARKDGCEHIGGSSLGGGTITGLASRFLGVHSYDELVNLAVQGNWRKADLMIGDLQGGAGSNLDPDLTASNFGNIKSDAADCDIAAALFHLIFENTGVFSFFALHGSPVRNVVLTGALAENPLVQDSFDIFNRKTEIFNLRVMVPDRAAFAPVIGALL